MKKTANEILEDAKRFHGVTDFNDKEHILKLIRYSLLIGFNEGWKECIRRAKKDGKFINK